MNSRFLRFYEREPNATAYRPDGMAFRFGLVGVRIIAMSVLVVLVVGCVGAASGSPSASSV